MLHFGMFAAGTPGSGSSIVTISLDPPPGEYSLASYPKTVTITVTGASRLRWKKNSGSWTTVASSTTAVAVADATALYADALSATSNVLASTFGNYSSPSL